MVNRAAAACLLQARRRVSEAQRRKPLYVTRQVSAVGTRDKRGRETKMGSRIRILGKTRYEWGQGNGWW